MPAQLHDDPSDFLTVTDATQVGLRDDGSPQTSTAWCAGTARSRRR